MSSKVAVPLLDTIGGDAHRGGAGTRGAPCASTDAEAVNQPRKRARTEGVGKMTDGEEAKRSRGRPRLSVTDETAADRRRTQIRLAQRAYRNRKDTAISSLEKKVQSLRHNNEEMNDAFIKLRDFAMSHGLLDLAPELGRQLLATTDKFASLVDSSSDDDGKVEGSHDSVTPPKNTTVPSSSRSPTSDNSNPTTTAPAAAWAGPSSYTTYDASFSSMSNTNFTDTQFPNFNQPTPTVDSLGYEIITQPTFENASFPIDLPDLVFGVPGPLASMPPPKSYADFESSFSRRLQRICVENAYKLVTMPSPPPFKLARVFGFRMTFETVEQIRQSLEGQLQQYIGSDLDSWRYPFVHLGGAGTQPTKEPRQSSANPLKPKHGTGFSTGPFTAPIMNVRNNSIGPKLQISLPSFEGGFYDSEDIEIYLRERGVQIPVGSDRVVVEVNMQDFTDHIDPEPDPEEPEQPAQTAMPRIAFPQTASASQFPQNVSSDYETAVHSSLGQPNSANQLLGPSGAAAAPQMTLPCGAPFGLPNANPQPLMPGNCNPAAAFFPIPTEASRNTSKQVVTLNVNLFMTELMGSARCLGRAPGFPRGDVNGAFRAAVKVGTSAW